MASKTVTGEFFSLIGQNPEFLEISISGVENRSRRGPEKGGFLGGFLGVRKRVPGRPGAKKPDFQNRLTKTLGKHLSRLGELLNTLRNVHFLAPGRVPRGTPGKSGKNPKKGVFSDFTLFAMVPPSGSILTVFGPSGTPPGSPRSGRSTPQVGDLERPPAASASRGAPPSESTERERVTSRPDRKRSRTMHPYPGQG